MRRRGLGTVLVGFGAVLTAVIASQTAVGGRAVDGLLHRLSMAAYAGHHGWLTTALVRALAEFVFRANDVLPLLFAGVSAATLAGLGLRLLARGYVARGMADPLDRVRARPRLVRAFVWLPAASFALAGLADQVNLLRSFLHDPSWPLASYAQFVMAGLLASTAMAAASRAAAGLAGRTLLAPLEADAAPPPAKESDLEFSAIPVTARTRAVVAAFAAATSAMVVLTLLAPSDPRFIVVLAGFVATAMAAPFALSRASRIAVGIDGVWVRDASRTRFFGYGALDEARVRGADLALVRDGRAVLRLQLHGDDAGRRDELLARINDAIARARASRTRGAEMLVQAMPARRVAASLGADSYRSPSVSREQLWELVEGPTTDGATRTAAAQALAAAFDPSERARLRVAASRCAEPRVRVALGQLASDDDGDLDAPADGALAHSSSRAWASNPGHSSTGRRG